ncbi:hypothetical protein vseg_000287 [Gypsophila vaccaria]
MLNGTEIAASCLYRAYLDPNQTKLDLSELALPPSFRPFLDKINRRNNHYLNGKYSWETLPTVYGKFEVVGSCNGLVLILSGLHHLAICNPTIEHETAFKILPCINFPGYLAYYWSDDEEFTKQYNQGNNYLNRKNRRIMYRVFGFGYDSINCLYKILYLTAKRAMMYSLAKGCRSWRFIDVPYDVVKYELPPVHDRPEGDPDKRVLMQVYGHGVSINNHLHWNITEFDPEVFEYSKEAILSFDICNEKWDRVPVSNELAINPYIIELGVLDGCLCVSTSRGIHRHGLELWIMKEYGVKESWTKLFKVPSGSGIPLFYHRERYEFLLSGTIRGLAWFNPKNNRIRTVEFYGCDFSGENYYSNRVKMCLESFVDPSSSMK